jgi:hypothetical protein
MLIIDSLETESEKRKRQIGELVARHEHLLETLAMDFLDLGFEYCSFQFSEYDNEYGPPLRKFIVSLRPEKGEQYSMSIVFDPAEVRRRQWKS